MKPFKTETRSIELNGQTIEVQVKVFCDHDDLTLDDVIGDAEDRATLEAKIERGDLMIAHVWVEASALGIDGSDHLGGCYIESSSDVDDTVRFHGMIQNAIDELKTNIIEQAKRLKPFAS